MTKPTALHASCVLTCLPVNDALVRHEGERGGRAGKSPLSGEDECYLTVEEHPQACPVNSDQDD